MSIPEQQASLVTVIPMPVLIDLVCRVFTNGLGDLGSISGCVIPNTLKLVLDSPCLTLSHIR